MWVADAHLETTAPETRVRDGVGIDRRDRVAARAGAVKFDLEVLPPDSAFVVRIELGDLDPRDEQLLAAALAEWEQGRGTIGGRVSRGLGAFTLEGVQRASCDLNDRDELIAFLKADEPWQQARPVANWLNKRLVDARTMIQPMKEDLADPFAALNAGLAVARAWLEVQFVLVAEGPFLVNDPLAQAQTGFDHAALLQGLLKPDQAERPKPVLPGASLRGVLRSQAERIARTLATLNAWKLPESQRSDHYATHCPACDPNARRKREASSRPVPLESCDSVLQARRVGTDQEVNETDLCLACWLFGSARQGSRLLVEDARFVGTKPSYKARDFLAIDRFTGGGAESYKFDAVEVWKPRFEVRLRLENPADWELGWLLLTLRDLQTASFLWVSELLRGWAA